jgi:hypothetical protein
MLKTLIIATMLLPTLAIAQRSQQLTAAETTRPMVPNGLDGERQLLRTGFRQGTGRHPQARLVSGRLARERQLLHPLRMLELGASGAAGSATEADHILQRARTSDLPT